MKNLGSLLLMFFSLLTTGLAQEIRLSVDTLDSKPGNEGYSYQSIDQYDQKLLFKLGAVDGNSDLLDNGSSLPFDLFAVEYKFSNTLSAEGTLYFESQDIGAISVRLRHYFNKASTANNLSGKYLALEYASVMDDSPTFDPAFGRDQAVLFQFGNQIKKSRFGYADFRVFTSYHFGPLENSLNLGFNVILGAAWGPLGDRSPLTSSSPFVNAHEHTLITIENASMVIGERFDAISFSSSIEQEMFIRGLTSRTQLSVAYSRQVAPGFSFEFMGLSVSEEIRKYFGLLKKPGTGRTTRSFSGVYAGGGLSNTLSFRRIDLIQEDESEEIRESGANRIIPNLAVGYQERLGKRFFFDVFIRYSFFTRNDFYENTKGDADLSFGTRVGLNWGW